MRFSTLTLAYLAIILVSACSAEFSSDQTTAVLASAEPNFEQSSDQTIDRGTIEQNPLINPEGMTVITRFTSPDGFDRVGIWPRGFETYLRTLPLKAHESPVKYYNGSEKTDYGYWAAVIDMPIGNRDLHQCADAIMRLRAEYLWSTEQYDKIHFNFVNGFNAEYSKWRNGQRIKVNGNDVRWVNSAMPSTSYESFWKYMEMVFSYAGTASLVNELKPVELSEMQIGDVFIRGGSPGHAVIVIDMAVNTDTDESVYLLAQSYMPAQEMHILTNPNDAALSPWYKLEEVEEINTPEWRFDKTELRRFQD
ncbi:DUF4846 domain-containing protein [Cryomorphaceae bacterium 1068]|nr:DUF4846 domain-containing protein [Cryomorphaceae bacterium 1068]